MKWQLSLQAKADLRRIGHRIARDSPQAAVVWVQKFQDRARQAGRARAGSIDSGPRRSEDRNHLAARAPLVGAPMQGRKVPEVDRDDVREAIVGNYRIVYIVQAKLVRILTIFEGHRLLPDPDLR